MMPEVTLPYRSKLFQLVVAKPGAPAVSTVAPVGSITRLIKEVDCELSMPPLPLPVKFTLTDCWACKATAPPISAKVFAKRFFIVFILLNGFMREDRRFPRLGLVTLI